MDSNSSRPVSEILHHAIANGDISTVQSLLKQGINADSRLHIDEEILETASRKSFASINSYRPHSCMDSNSVREYIVEEDNQNIPMTDEGECTYEHSSKVVDEHNQYDMEVMVAKTTTHTISNEAIDDEEDELDKIMRKCQEDVEKMQLDATVIEVKTGEVDSKSDADYLNSDAESLQSDADYLKSDDGYLKSDADYLKSDAEYLKSDADYLRSDDGYLKSDTEYLKSNSDYLESDANEHSVNVVITHQRRTVVKADNKNEPDFAEEKGEANKSTDYTADFIELDSTHDYLNLTTSSLENENVAEAEQHYYVDLRNNENTGIEVKHELLNDKESENNNNNRKSIADTIDERLHDENETLIERTASVRVKEQCYMASTNETTDSSGATAADEKPLKLIPRIKRRLSQKWKKPKKENLDEEDEDDDLTYENIRRPRNVDDEQLNENFEGVAFFEAVREGMDMIVQTLLETSNNYQLNMLDENGFTPIMQAAWHGQNECLHILLDHGAQTDLKNATGCTAAHFAAGQGRTDCLELLISFDNDVVDMKTKYGATPLLLAAKGGHTECVETLLNAGADPNTQYRGNQNALLFAAGNGHYECIQELLKHEVQVDQPNAQQVTPLMRAVQQGHNTCVSLLLENSTNVNLQDAIGRTAVHFSVEYNNPKALKLLLQSGASVELKTKGDSKALNYAERFQNTRCAEIIENHLNKLKEEREKERELDATIHKQQEKTNNVSCLSFKHLFRKKKSKNAEKTV